MEIFDIDQENEKEEKEDKNRFMFRLLVLSICIILFVSSISLYLWSAGKKEQKKEYCLNNPNVLFDGYCENKEECLKKCLDKKLIL